MVPVLLSAVPGDTTPVGLGALLSEDILAHEVDVLPLEPERLTAPVPRRVTPSMRRGYFPSRWADALGPWADLWHASRSQQAAPLVAALLERMDRARPDRVSWIWAKVRLPGAARKGRHFTVRILRNGLLAASSSVLLAGAAHAAPVSATAIPPSSYSLSISAGALGTASGAGAMTGSASTSLTVVPGGGSPDLVTSVGGSGSFNVADFTAPGLALGLLAFDNFHVDVTLPAMTSTNGTIPVFHPDLAGAVVSVDGGQVIQGGSATLFDFSKTPVVATAPVGSLTTLDLAAGLWTIPFTATSTLTTFGIPVDIVTGTDLVLQFVPEPGTLTLLGVGVVGLAATRRRRVSE
jgi:PEP-CTERM motif